MELFEGKQPVTAFVPFWGQIIGYFHSQILEMGHNFERIALGIKSKGTGNSLWSIKNQSFTFSWVEI